jgi:hypothetical protein
MVATLDPHIHRDTVASKEDEADRRPDSGTREQISKESGPKEDAVNYLLKGGRETRK